MGIFIQEQPFEGGMSSRARLIVPVLVFLLLCLLEDSQCGAARQRARHRRLFRGEKRETVKRSVGPMAAFLNQERPEDYQLPDRFGPGLGFDENTAEFGGYLTKEVPKECFYSKLMGGLVCSYSD